MAEKRKDNKGRILKDGEHQRKDGKYEFKYKDLTGERRSVYSWKLISTDRVPQGKRDGLSLRELENEIQELLRKKNSIQGSKILLEECIGRHLEMKKFANSTYENYVYYFNKDIKGSWIGRKRAIDVKTSDVKRFYSEFSKKGYANGTIQILHKLIHPALQLLVDDEVLGRNPSDGCCKDYAEGKSREAMLIEEREVFFEEVLKYNKNGEKYRIIFTVMKGLSCRINELIGLTWKDIDMKNRSVSINHGLVFRKKEGKIQFYATKGTDKNKERVLYMTDEVYACFRKLQQKRFEHPSTMVVDGYSDFVFVSGSGTPMYPGTLNKALYKMVDKYNEANNGNFPKISNHIFRHTGCTEMAEAEVEPGTMQYVMGHNSYKQIRKTYDRVSKERVRKQMEKLNRQDSEKVKDFTTDLRQKIV